MPRPQNAGLPPCLNPQPDTNMPVRIYDIAQRLGLENKQVLDQAKRLGIAAARVASSSLDTLTAEYLEDNLRSNPPPPAAIQVPQPNTAPAQPAPEQAKATSITIHSTGTEIRGLVERILAGDILLLVEVSTGDGSPSLRAKLVPEEPAASAPAPKPRPDPTPRAELDERTKDLFRAAFFSARHVSKDDWVNLAEYGSALKRQDPTFQPQDFGERSLGGLVRRMIDDFDIKADTSTPPVYYIRLKPHATTSQPQPAPPPSQQPAQPRRHATGKVHNLKLGFGFIAPEDGSENIFFHATEVIGCTIFDLRPGDPVEYESGVNERGPCAWKVRRLGANLQTVSA